jgi:hypothetical protein
MAQRPTLHGLWANGSSPFTMKIPSRLSSSPIHGSFDHAFA